MTLGPAPLDRSALERVVQPFGQGRLLPRDAYTSEEVLRWEREVSYYGLFPNLLLSIHPDYVMTHRHRTRRYASA